MRGKLGTGRYGALLCRTSGAPQVRFAMQNEKLLICKPFNCVLESVLRGKNCPHPTPTMEVLFLEFRELQNVKDT